VADRERAYYDSGDRWLPLVEQCRPRYEPDGWLRTAAPLDGGEPGCVWHRLMLDARMPPGGAVEVWSRAADEPAALRTVAWEREPSPIRHAGGPDRPYLRGLDAYEVWETLFQRARGRWLELRLHLTGDGRSSPRLRSMRVHYPRFSYLRNYLPAVYREDAGSASFLDRFLANVEGIDTQIEDRIASAQALLDPRSVPAEALDWLGSFFDVALDPAWSESRRRTFIAHALDLFRWRGTPRGLRMALRLALDDAPGADADAFAEPEGRCTLAYRIVETFRSRSAPAVTLGDPGEGPAVVAASPGRRWKPSDGGAALDERYAEYLGGGAKRAWPLTAPAARAAEWHAFNHSVLGFEPTARRDDPGDRARWRDFLARRYRSPRELATAYAIHAHDFGAVRLPTSLPPDGAPLEDWYRFETIVLATARLAHRFVVLLPARLDDDSPDHAADEARRRLAQRVVELQKPAHTVFGVRFYWSAFRLGEARLGEGTVIGRGSRSAGLLRPAVLGRDHVGESRLGGDPPPRLTRPPSFGRRPDSEEETT
jgi:phage tail-like protein